MARRHRLRHIIRYAGRYWGPNDASSWIAGENRALSDHVIYTSLDVGFACFQEFSAADDALDEALIFEIGLTFAATSNVFSEVLAIPETTALDPDAREFNSSAPVSV